MEVQGINEAYKSISAGKLQPVYLFAGEESYLKEQLLQTLCENYLGGEDPVREARKVEGKEFPLKEILEELSRPGLFSGGKKVAVIRHPPYLEAPSISRGKDVAGDTEESSRGKKNSREEEELLSSYRDREMNKALPEGIIVFWVDNADKRKKLFKLLEKWGVTINCSPLKGETLKRWVKKEASKYGKSINPAALEKLLLFTQGDMNRIAREIDKISCYLEISEKEITSEQVETLVHSDSRGNIFQLVDALGEGDLSRAYLELQSLFAVKEPPVKILYMIVRHFRLLISTLSCLEKGYSRKELASLLQVQPFVASKLHAQAKGYHMKELEDIYRALHQVDIQIKRGKIDPYQGLELILGKIYGVKFSRQDKIPSP